MEVRTCSRCKKIFQYLSGPPLCPECKRQDEEDFKRIKEYLEENKGASLQQVAEELDIPVDKITRFLREGRLEVKEGYGIVLECENCGKPISSGRFCRNCTGQLGDRLQGINSQIKEKSDHARESQMRFLRREDEK